MDYLELNKANFIPVIRRVVDEICAFESNRFPDLNSAYNDQAPNLKVVEIAYIQRILNILFWSKAFRFMFLRGKIKSKKIYFPLKPAWLSIVKSNGFEVSKFISVLLFYFFCSFIFFRDLILKSKRIQKFDYINEPNKKVVFIDELTNSQIDNKDEKLFVFTRWLQEFVYPDEKILIQHSNPRLRNFKPCNELRSLFIPRLINPIGTMKRLHLILKIITYIFKNLNFSIFMQIPNLMEYFAVLYFTNELIAKEFIFNCSRGSNMPLWVHGLVQKKIMVNYVFYSLTTEPNYLDGKIPGTELWRVSTWPKIICIDEIQISEIFRFSKLIKFDYVCLGVPWWLDSSADLPLTTKPYVALFDSYIGKRGLSLSVLSQYGFDLDKKTKMYLENVVEFAVKNNFQVLIKFKRDSFLNTTTQTTILNQLKVKYPDSIFIVESNISPFRIIEGAKLVICKPFSTIGMIAKEKGISVVEYNVSDFPITGNFHMNRQIDLISDAELLPDIIRNIN